MEFGYPTSSLLPGAQRTSFVDCRHGDDLQISNRPCPWRIHRSCSNRGLVQSATVPLPAVGAELNGRCRAFNGRLWHTSCKPGVRTMAIIVMLEIDELCFQIGAGPEERSVQVLAANGSDQSLHEWVRQRYVGNGLDFHHFEYAKIGLPLMKSI